MEENPLVSATQIATSLTTPTQQLSTEDIIGCISSSDSSDSSGSSDSDSEESSSEEEEEVGVSGKPTEQRGGKQLAPPTLPLIKEETKTAEENTSFMLDQVINVN